MGSTIDSESRSAEAVAVGAVILLFIAISILFHSLVCSTPMEGLTDAQWEKRMTIHSSVYPFDHRFPVTHLTRGVHQSTGLPYRQSFYLVEYLLLAFTGLLFYRFLKELEYGFGAALTGLTLFLSAYPVQLGFSDPVHTWDDIWVYGSLIITVGALFKRRMIVAALAFTVGLFAREQTLTLFPLYVAGVWMFGDSFGRRTRIVISLAPLLLFLPFFLPPYKATVPMPEIWSINWGSTERAANSVFSLANSFGILWITWIFGLIYYFRRPIHERTAESRFLAWGSVYVVAVTLATVLSVGFVRETRLLFPPFLWMITVSLWWLVDVARRVRQWPVWGKILLVPTVSAAIYYGMPIGKIWLPVLDYRNCEAVCQGWLGVQVGLASFLILLAGVMLMLPRRSGQPTYEPDINRKEIVHR